jgi:hypothetical protein
MEEQLITFDTAKIAKEKGFDLEFCNVGWHGDFGDLKGDSYPFLGTYSFYKSMYCNNKDEHQIQRPTQPLLQKWLREVHNINIFMTFKPNIKKWDFIPYSMDMNGKEYIKYNSEYTKQNNERRFKSYEEALEVGLQESLKLIKDELV